MSGDEDHVHATLDEVLPILNDDDVTYDEKRLTDVVNAANLHVSTIAADVDRKRCRASPHPSRISALSCHTWSCNSTSSQERYLGAVPGSTIMRMHEPPSCLGCSLCNPSPGVLG